MNALTTVSSRIAAALSAAILSLALIAATVTMPQMGQVLAAGDHIASGELA
jgi:hypothetical protein